MATGTNAIRAGRAFVELFADDSQLVRGLRQAEKRLKAFGQRLRHLGLKLIGLGSALAAPLLASARLFAGYGDSVAKLARRTGVSVEALSELGYAAEQSDTSLEALGQTLFRMNRRIANAATGSGPAVRALRDLGLEAQAFAKLDAATQFKVLADRLNAVENPALAAQYAFEILGDGARELMPLLQLGSEGMAVLEAEARALGLTLSSEDAQAAEALTDAMARLWKVLRMGVFHIGAALAPTLKLVAERLTRVAMVVSDWIQANQQLIVNVLKVAAIIVGAGVALVALGTLISGLGAAIGGLITILTTVAAVLKLLAGVIAFLVTPIGAVLAAVAALAGYLVYATDVGAKALGWLGERFGRLQRDATDAFQGIADALAAGDIALAARVLWLTLKMEWTRGINVLKRAWLSFRDFFIRTGHDAFHGLLATAQFVWHGLEVGWIETTAFFTRLWTNFTSFFARTWETIKADAQKAWNWIKSLFDESIDLQAENQLVEQQKQAAIAQIDDDQQRQVAQREAQREAQRRQAAALHEATLGEIGQQNLEKHRDLDTAYARRMAENEADLARAREEWRQAVEAARQKREAREADAGPDGLDGPDAILSRARDALAGLGDIGDLIEQQAAKIGVKGTFNATALRGMGSGDAADRTAKATEETARHTRRLAQQAQSGGLHFA